MSEEGGAFDAFKGRKPPAPSEILGATGAGKDKKEPTDRTAQIQMRTKPDIKRAIKKAAADADTPMNKYLEQCFFAFDGVAPPVETVVVEKPVIEATDARDLNNGLTELLAIFGDEIVLEALPKLADYEGLTPSQLVKAMLLEKIIAYQNEGKDVGYKVE